METLFIFRTFFCASWKLIAITATVEGITKGPPGYDGTFIADDSGQACSMREPDLWRRFLQIFYKLFQAQSMEIYIIMLRMLEHLLFNLCFDSQLSLHCV